LNQRVFSKWASLLIELYHPAIQGHFIGLC
jgi:hypothetical protein